MAKSSKRSPKFTDKLLRRFAPPLTALYIKFLSRTLRIEVDYRERYERAIASGRPIVMVFWHEDLVNIALTSMRFNKNPVAVMVSHSRDGELLSGVLRGIDMIPVRGSSSRGAIRGFSELRRFLMEGGHAHPVAALAPDGPRGPRRVAKPGAAMLARMAGALVFPMQFKAHRATVFKSWDRMILPLPFSRLEVHVPEPFDAAQWGGDDAANSDLIASKLAPKEWREHG